MKASRRGVSYPLADDGAGGLKLSEDIDLIPEYIVSVVETRPGERILRQNYGTQDLLFLPVTFGGYIASLLNQSVRAQVLEPDTIEVSDRVNSDQSVDVEIGYLLKNIPQAPLRFKLTKEII